MGKQEPATDVPAGIEARLRQLEDLVEIQQLFVDYGRHLDRGDFEAYANLFAHDGEIMLGPLGRAKGRDEIRATMERVMAGREGSSFHIISSPVIELDGDTATSEVMWTAVQRGEDGTPRLTMLGRHADDLVRENGRWRIKRRKGLIDLPAELPRST